MRFVSHRAPFRQVVRPLFFDVCLCVYAVLPGELLHDWILDFDRPHGFAEIGKRAAPTQTVSTDPTNEFLEHVLPFCWRNNLHDSGLHSVLVDLVDEALEVAELVHSLRRW